MTDDRRIATDDRRKEQLRRATDHIGRGNSRRETFYLPPSCTEAVRPESAPLAKLREVTARNVANGGAIVEQPTDAVLEARRERRMQGQLEAEAKIRAAMAAHREETC